MTHAGKLEKPATGEGEIVTDFCIVLVQPKFVATARETLYVFAMAYVYDGFFKKDVPLAASPKPQVQLVILLSVGAGVASVN